MTFGEQFGQPKFVMRISSRNSSPSPFGHILGSGRFVGTRLSDVGQEGADSRFPCSVNIADFAPFLARPTLRSFSVRCGALTRFIAGWWPELAPFSVHLTKLEFVQCHVPPEALEVLLETCINLKSLSLKDHTFDHLSQLQGMDEAEESFVHPEHFNLQQQLPKILRRCKGTLEALAIDGGPFWEFQPMVFQDFTKLHTLEVERGLLADDLARCFPPSLESLHIRYCGFDAILGDEQWSFWKNVRSKANCPVLRNVRMVGGINHFLTIERTPALAKIAGFTNEPDFKRWAAHGEPRIIVFEENAVFFTMELDPAQCFQWRYTYGL